MWPEYKREYCAGAGETAQQFRSHTVLGKDTGLVPGTHVMCLTTFCNSNLREFSVLFWIL